MKQNVMNCVSKLVSYLICFLQKSIEHFVKFDDYVARMKELKFEGTSVLKKLKENKRVQISYKEYSGNAKHK